MVKKDIEYKKTILEVDREGFEPSTSPMPRGYPTKLDDWQLYQPIMIVMITRSKSIRELDT